MYWLRTLGGFGIERDGVVLDRVAAHRKALALLAVLAAQGSTSRDRLMLLLWPDADGPRARSSLKQAVHLLRRQLEAPDLLLGTQELRLNPERITSDVAQFAAALADGEAEAAVRHYGGPFLDGVHLDRTVEFEHWADSRRTELARQYMDALEQLARAADERADHVAAARWWRMLQAADPFNGRAAVSLMRALENGGDRAAALQHGRTHTTLVLHELGIPADPAVEELASRLRSDHEPAPGRIPTVVPRRETPPVAHDTSHAPAAADGVPPRHTGEAFRVPPGRGSIFERAAVPRLGLAVAACIIAGIGAAAFGAFGRTATGESAGPSSDSAAASHERGSIAVLPFVDLSPSGDREYFSDGMTVELITALSRVEGLKVAASTSAFQFRGALPDVRQVGERLGVAHVLAGSVRTDGGRLRISVQLVSAENGYQLWAESYDRPMRSVGEVIAVQEEISRAIVRALQVRLGTAALTPGVHIAVPTTDMAAYARYQRGLHFLNRLQIPRAIENLEAATSLDPQFSRAYSALAEAYAVPAAWSEGSPVENHTRGIAAAEAALEIDPDLADAHAALGWLRMIALRWDEAGRSLHRAVELDPSAPRARLYLAVYLHRRDRLDDAVTQLRHARELDPLSFHINALYGSVLADLGQSAEALRILHATLELDPDFATAHAILGHIHLGEGRSNDAVRHYEHAAASVPGSYYAGFLGHAYARTGRTADARRILGMLEARTDAGEYVSQGAIGWIRLGLDERDAAFRHLEAAAAHRDVFLTVYGVLSNRYLSGPFRDDPRFRGLREQVGLSP